MTEINLDGLTVAERIQLAMDIWDSLHDAAELLELTDEQRALLDRRLAEHRADPGSAIPWPKMRDELFSKLNQRDAEPKPSGSASPETGS